jgi:DNA-binding transcriptional LysR family regulator
MEVLMDRLQAMASLVRVAETGSFSAVARELGSTQSLVSKQVAALEAYLGAKLLSRTTRSVSLTDEGRSYVDAARRILQETQEAEEALRGQAGQVSGHLRLGASAGFGRIVLFPIVRAFMAEHRQLAVDLQLSDSFVDVVEQGLDAVVRVGELADSSLVAQRVGTAERSVVASKALAAQLNREKRLPKVPGDLSEHDCVVYTGLTTPNTWIFDAKEKRAQEQVKVSGRFQTNSTEVVREAVLAGLGIGFAPNWFFTQELAQGKVVRLLPLYAPRPLPIHMLYPISRKHSSKLAAFASFTRSQLIDKL